MAVVSGNIDGKTQTATLRVEDAYQFAYGNYAPAYGISLVLAAMAIVVLVTMIVVQPKEASLMSISVRSVTKQFGDFVALDDVSIEVARGVADRAARPERQRQVDAAADDRRARDAPMPGAVFIDDEDVTGRPPQERGVGFVFQHYAAFKHMTVYDNVAFGMKIRKRPKAEIARARGAAAELVQLEGLAKRYPSQLSGGQRQRMGLARALAVDPAVLLLDEPFGALDARVRAELRDWLRRLHDETHTTTVIVTHDQEEAMEVADEVVVMNQRHGSSRSPRRATLRAARERVRDDVRRPGHRIGDAFVRPHDLEVTLEPNGSTREAMIERIVHLGFEVRRRARRRGRRAALRRSSTPRPGRAARARGRPDRLHQAARQTTFT